MARDAGRITLHNEACSDITEWTAALCSVPTSLGLNNPKSGRGDGDCSLRRHIGKGARRLRTQQPRHDSLFNGEAHAHISVTATATIAYAPTYGEGAASNAVSMEEGQTLAHGGPREATSAGFVWGGLCSHLF